ncbi:PA2169 family four-helix-bundle protein [Brevundimonas sp.]|uniref:PA2169 family four-helix-bundle protein n=1 Tax=Brevundimonas sp. TaxID=1871086 RepID=UPI0025C35AE0|nr:PA2169 family four-helix-bundle protein [Brevundimonas sp.]
MSNPNAHDIKVLNGLIETALDSADGYREAAEEARDDHYRSLFEQRSAERQRVVDDLSAAVRGMGGDPEVHGSILAKAHRAFLDVKHALLRNDDSVVGSINSGESFIADKFERALEDKAISATTRETVRRAYASVKAEHDQMEALKHSLEGQRDDANPLFPH